MLSIIGSKMDQLCLDRTQNISILDQKWVQSNIVLHFWIRNASFIILILDQKWILQALIFSLTNLSNPVCFHFG
jgi:hypothetical protein